MIVDDYYPVPTVYFDSLSFDFVLGETIAVITTNTVTMTRLGLYNFSFDLLGVLLQYDTPLFTDCEWMNSIVFTSGSGQLNMVFQIDNVVEGSSIEFVDGGSYSITQSTLSLGFVGEV